jgi:hypothetical protein
VTNVNPDGDRSVFQFTLDSSRRLHK